MTMKALRDELDPILTLKQLRKFTQELNTCYFMVTDFNPIKYSDQTFKCFEDSLASNSTVISLDLGNCHIGDRGVKNLASALWLNSRLTSISLSVL
jgi:hypothetical protein